MMNVMNDAPEHLTMLISVHHADQNSRVTIVGHVIAMFNKID